MTKVLQYEERISYRALKQRFNLDDHDIEDLKDELISAKRVARDEDDRVLVWSGEAVLRAASGAAGSVSCKPSLARCG
ncbi:MAG: hypothetical protein V3S24_18290 [Candidatus Tectomicrobia bacterium]